MGIVSEWARIEKEFDPRNEVVLAGNESCRTNDAVGVAEVSLIVDHRLFLEPKLNFTRRLLRRDVNPVTARRVDSFPSALLRGPTNRTSGCNRFAMVVRSLLPTAS